MFLFRGLVVGSILSCWLGSACAGAQSDGVVNFVGVYAATGCAIDGASGNQVVDLGAIDSSDIANGAESQAVPFTIVLRDCAGASVQVSLVGQADSSGDERMLALSGEAKGAGLIISDKRSGRDLVVNGTPSGWEDISDTKRENVMAFTARLKGSGDSIVLGDFTSTAEMRFSYQ